VGWRWRSAAHDGPTAGCSRSSAGGATSRATPDDISSRLLPTWVAADRLALLFASGRATTNHISALFLWRHVGGRPLVALLLGSLLAGFELCLRVSPSLLGGRRLLGSLLLRGYGLVIFLLGLLQARLRRGQRCSTGLLRRFIAAPAALSSAPVWPTFSTAASSAARACS